MQILDDLSWLKNLSFMKKTQLDSRVLTQLDSSILAIQPILSAVISKMNGLKFVANNMFNE